VTRDSFHLSVTRWMLANSTIRPMISIAVAAEVPVIPVEIPAVVIAAVVVTSPSVSDQRISNQGCYEIEVMAEISAQLFD
jgi:hypothetical protein